MLPESRPIKGFVFGKGKFLYDYKSRELSNKVRSITTKTSSSSEEETRVSFSTYWRNERVMVTLNRQI